MRRRGRQRPPAAGRRGAVRRVTMSDGRRDARECEGFLAPKRPREQGSSPGGSRMRENRVHTQSKDSRTKASSAGQTGSVGLVGGVPPRQDPRGPPDLLFYKKLTLSFEM